MEVIWKETFITEVTWIDAQHKQIIQNIKAFLDAVADGRANEEIKRAMSVLSEFVDTHFETEENYMERYQYPRFEEHRKQHANYEKVVDYLTSEYELEFHSPEFIKKIETVLFRYWNDHIPDYDKPLARFLKKQRQNW